MMAYSPLRTVGGSRFAVLGHLADSQRDTLGPWVFAHETDETVTILGGLRRHLGDEIAVEYAPATAVPERLFPSMLDEQEPGGVPRTPEGFDEDAEMDRAAGLAAGADVAIVVVGQPQNMIGENASASSLDPPGRQLELLQRVHATGTPVVVLVMSGRPLDLRWADEHAAAILQVWCPGTRGGDAVARALVGDVAPAGRLPFTWPGHVGQVPMVYSHYRTFAPQDQGKRYWDEPSTPLYPFGHGLSYASFECTDLRVPEHLPVGESTRVLVTVTNTSEVAADDVVQLNIHQRYGTSTRPLRELKGFQRVHVGAGESRDISLDLGPEQLRYWSDVTRGWVQDATVVDVFVGGDSAATLTASVTISG